MDHHSVGGLCQQRVPLYYASSPEPCAADVSMETLASMWAVGVDGAPSRCRRDPPPPAGSVFEMWPDVSPQLQKNRQLQDTLQQREEELARLQEENVNLKEFLSSTLLKNLQQKAEALGVAAGHKRSSPELQDPSFCYRGDTLGPGSSTRITKRVCRNLMSEICSAATTTGPANSPAHSPAPAPAPCGLDQWVLRTLGLKDADTIDHSPPPPPPLCCPSPEVGVGVAFSMSLNPRCSVKTHSFPQGQAFLRSTGGRWAFTWVPRQEP